MGSWLASTTAFGPLRRNVKVEPVGRRPRSLIIKPVRSAGLATEAGCDAGKKTKGQKLFILVDTFGHILAILVTPADRLEREGAKDLLDDALIQHGWLRKLWVDGGYSGEDFAQYMKELRPKQDVEVVKRSDTAQGFQVVPRRWVVGRTFGWLMRMPSPHPGLRTYRPKRHGVDSYCHDTNHAASTRVIAGVSGDFRWALSVITPFAVRFDQLCPQRGMTFTLVDSTESPSLAVTSILVEGTQRGQINS